MRRKQIRQEPNATEGFVAKLSSKNEIERARANEAIMGLGDRAVDELLAVIAVETGKQRGRKRLMYVLIAVYVAFIVTMLLCGQGDMIGSYVGMFTSGLGMAAFSQTQKNAAKFLANFEDKRVVGPLTDMLSSDDKSLKSISAQALGKLLPMLNSSDGELLDDVQRAILCKSLRTSNTALNLAILKAFEQIGDEKMVPTVEKLAAGESKSSKNNAALRIAASECLPLLKISAERDRAARTLLRPAQSPDEPSAILLRPAHDVVSGDSATLLRPVERDDLQSQTATEPEMLRVGSQQAD